MQIVRKFIGASNINPSGQRYNVDTDTVQTLVNGTWVDTPTADPRINPAFNLPPRSGDTAACDTAANMVAKTESLIGYYVATATQVQIVAEVVSFILLFFGGIGLVAEVIWSVVNFIVGLGTTTVSSAFTSDVYDRLTCYILQNLNGSNQLDASGLAAVLGDVAGGESSVVSDVLNVVYGSIGFVGLNNAGATGEETGDCDTCVDPGCYEWNFVALCAQLGWGHYAGVFTGSPYCFFQQTCDGGVGTNSAVNPFIDWHTLGHIIISHMEMDLEIIGDVSHWQIYRQQSADPADIVLMGEDDIAVGVSTVAVDFADEDWYGIDLLVLTPSGCGSGDAYVKAVRVTSPNLAPIGLTPNC